MSLTAAPVHPVDEIPSPGRALAAAVQHVVVMLATPITSVLLTAAAGIVLVPLARRLVTRLPAVVMAAMVVVIGVNLVKVAGGLIGDRPSRTAVGLAAVTIVATVLNHRFLPAGWRRLSVLLGMVTGSLVAAALGQFHWKPAAGLTQSPALFPFGTPHFDVIAAIPLLVFSIGSMAEATGQTVLNAKVVGKDIDTGELSRRPAPAARQRRHDGGSGGRGGAPGVHGAPALIVRTVSGCGR